MQQDIAGAGRQSAGRSVGRADGKSVGRAIGWSDKRSVEISIGCSVGRSFFTFSFCIPQPDHGEALAKQSPSLLLHRMFF